MFSGQQILVSFCRGLVDHSEVSFLGGDKLLYQNCPAKIPKSWSMVKKSIEFIVGNPETSTFCYGLYISFRPDSIEKRCDFKNYIVLSKKIYGDLISF